MKAIDNPPLCTPVTANTQSRIVFREDTSSAPYNIAGWGLLGIFLCFLIQVLAGVRLTDPGSELEAARRLTDSSWAFLAGAALVLHRTRNQQSPEVEVRLMKWLKRICIAAIFGYVLLAAVAWNASFRLGKADRAWTRQSVAEIHRQASQQRAMAGQRRSEQAGAVESVRVRESLATEALARDAQKRESGRSRLAVRIIVHSLIAASLCFGLVRLNQD